MRELVFLILASVSLHAEIIDRIVAVVDGHIITRSDVTQEREIRTILGEKAIDDKALVEQLTESYLIETQLTGFPGIEVDDEAVAEEMARLPKKEGLSSAALRDAVHRRIRTARYLNLRFRQFLRASDEDVRKYYENVFGPEARTRGINPVPPLEQVTDAVRKNVVEELMDREVTTWLEAIRRRSNLEILD